MRACTRRPCTDSREPASVFGLTSWIDRHTINPKTGTLSRRQRVISCLFLKILHRHASGAQRVRTFMGECATALFKEKTSVFAVSANLNRGRLHRRAQYYPVPESGLASCHVAFCGVSRTVVLFVVEEMLGPSSRARRGVHHVPKQRYITLSHLTTQANSGLS